MKWRITIKTAAEIYLRNVEGDPATIERDIGLEFEDEPYGITTMQVPA
jgi:hypothetical protein